MRKTLKFAPRDVYRSDLTTLSINTDLNRSVRRFSATVKSLFRTCDDGVKSLKVSCFVFVPLRGWFHNLPAQHIEDDFRLH